MSETSRKKTLPLAVLAAPALAFGSLTFAAAPAMAVPADEVEAIFAEDGIDTILVFATEDVAIYRNGEEDGTHPAGSPLFVPEYDSEEQQFIGYDGARYDIAPFEHATAAQYEEEDLEVPTFIQELEGGDDADENVTPEISINTTDARVGDTVRITINNSDEVLDSYDFEDYSIVVNGDLNTGESFGIFGEVGIEQADDEDTYTFTIPESVETDSGEIPVGPDSSFTFRATFVINPDVAGEEVNTYSNLVTLNIIAGETPGNGDENSDEDDTPEPTETATPTPEPTEPSGPTEDSDPVEPALTLDQDEIFLEDFVGDPEEGNGVLHTITGVAPGTELEYSVDTPDAIAPFSSSEPAVADEEGVAEFWIHGYEGGNVSAYLGDYTTVVTYQDDDGEEQELTANFSVVTAEDDDAVTPVVETEDPTEETEEPIAEAEETETQAAVVEDEEEDTPAVGSSDPQLADTGASGAQLAWIAGGLLAVGGAFVLYANRARLFGRKN